MSQFNYEFKDTKRSTFDERELLIFNTWWKASTRKGEGREEVLFLFRPTVGQDPGTPKAHSLRRGCP
jgi:hypothetical protein